MNITEFLVIARIRQLCAKKGWSYYRLAKESGIPYSTLNTMMLKTNAPSITTLSKICNGLGVTLAQFFDEQSEPEMLTHEQRECLRIWDSLNRTEKKQAIAYMQDCMKGCRIK